MGILESLLNADWVKDQLLNNSFEFWTWTIEVFLVGVVIGLGIGKALSASSGKSQARAKPTLSERRDQNARRKEAIRVLQSRNVGAWAAWARRLDSDNKLLLLYLMDHDHVDVHIDGFEFESCVIGMEQVLVINDISHDTHRMRLSEDGRAIMAKFGDIIAEALPNSHSWWRSHMVDVEPPNARHERNGNGEGREL